MPERIYIVVSGCDQYWTGKRWVSCLRCAKRMTEDEAHEFAHLSGAGLRVRRSRPRATPAPSDGGPK